MNKFLLSVMVVMCALLLALPSFGAMSDTDFIEICKTGTAKQVDDAIKAGVNVNAKDKNGVTALMFAAGLNENPAVITALIKAGADVKAEDKNGWTALDYARVINNTAAIKCLEPFTAMSDEDFIELCKTGTAQQVTDAIKVGANVNAKDDDDRTALMFAARDNDNPEVIAALIKAGADINNSKNDHGGTVLMFAAAANKNPEVTAALINAGADINAKANDGTTVLMLAAANNENPEVIAALIKAGSDINAKNNKGETVLMTAEKYNKNPEVLYKVGMMLATGDGVEEDQWEAVEWFRAAAKKGHKAARNELAKRGIYN